MEILEKLETTTQNVYKNYDPLEMLEHLCQTEIRPSHQPCQL
jgi:hypothetical protein